MILRMDGIEIKNRLIVDEVEHLTPDYREVSIDQPVEEKENQRLEWAWENVTEPLLFFRYAHMETLPIPEEKEEIIEQAYHQILTQPDVPLKELEIKKEWIN